MTTPTSALDAPRVPATSQAAPPRGAVRALGFGTAVAMWGAAYACRLPQVDAPGWVLAALFVLCYLAGGAYAGRRLPGSALWAGARVGAVTSLLNLLILGSVLSEHGGRLAFAGAAGTIAIGAALSAAGAQLARLRSAEVEVLPASEWTAALARVAAGATLLLLGVGGLVTSHDAGLAVPDWPNTFASNMFLYPLSRMTGGIYYEHTHRLFGALVGLTTLALAAQVTRTDARRWVKGLAWGLFVLVCVQGLMGGLRVTGSLTLAVDRAQLSPQTSLALVHGVTAQLFFSGLAALAAILSFTWRQPTPATPEGEEEEALPGTRELSGWLVALLAAQLVLGASVRHFHWGLALHITGGVGVLLLGIAVGLRAWGLHEARPVLPRLGVALAWAVGFQFLLGMGAYATTALAEGEGLLSAYQAPVTTLHQTTGAVVLALGVLVHLWSRRLSAATAPALAVAASDGLGRS